jgi:hypothetical protein
MKPSTRAAIPNGVLIVLLVLLGPWSLTEHSWSDELLVILIGLIGFFPANALLGLLGRRRR